MTLPGSCISSSPSNLHLLRGSSAGARVVKFSLFAATELFQCGLGTFFRLPVLRYLGHCLHGGDHGCTISLFWPYVTLYHEGVNGSRHDNAAALAFVDGHAEVWPDPDRTINPPYRDSPFFLEYWDNQHKNRLRLWPDQ